MKIKERLKKIIAGFMTVQMVLTFMVMPSTVSAAPIVDDGLGPVVNITSPVATTLRGTVDVRGTVTDDNPDHYWLVIQTLGSVTVAGPGTVSSAVSFTDQSLFSWNTLGVADGGYVVKLEATDAVGNKDANSIKWLNVIVDNTAPIISGVSNGVVYNTSVTPTFNEGTATLNGSPFLSGTEISADGTYTLIVTDAAGNSTTVNFVVDQFAPNAPVNPVPANDYINSTVVTKLSWDAVDDAHKPVEYLFEISDSSATTGGSFNTTLNVPAWSTSPEAPMPSVTEGTVYYWHVKAQDYYGKESAWSTMWQFTVDNTNPTVDAGADIPVTNNATLHATADDNLGITNIAKYQWTYTGPGTLTLDDKNPDTNVTADTDGVYTLTLTVWDQAGNNASDDLTLIWDGTVNPVTDFYLVAGDGFVDLNWTNPADTDFAGVKIFRSTVEGELGTELATVAKTGNSYNDIQVLNGKTYYYAVQAQDDIGNTKDSIQIVATPTATQFALLNSSGSQSDTSFGEANQIAQNPTGGEVKSGTSDQKKDESKSEDNKDTKSLPYFGIAMLVILALVGIYLLYLQNPEWFSALMFWKKK